MQVYKFDIPELKDDPLNYMSLHVFPYVKQPYFYEYDKQKNIIIRSSFFHGKAIIKPEIVEVPKIDNIVFKDGLEKICKNDIYFNTLVHLFAKSVVNEHFCMDYSMKKQDGKIYVYK